VKELRAFEKVALEPGEEKPVEFTLGFDDFSLLDENLKRVVEPGAFELMIGASAADIRLKGTVEVR
jgi:beta-glucosidase